MGSPTFQICIVFCKLQKFCCLPHAWWFEAQIRVHTDTPRNYHPNCHPERGQMGCLLKKKVFVNLYYLYFCIHLKSAICSLNPRLLCSQVKIRIRELIWWRWRKVFTDQRRRLFGAGPCDVDSFRVLNLIGDSSPHLYAQDDSTMASSNIQTHPCYLK